MRDMTKTFNTRAFDPRSPAGIVKLRYIHGEIDDEEMERQLAQALKGDLEMPHETPESHFVSTNATTAFF